MNSGGYILRCKGVGGCSGLARTIQTIEALTKLNLLQVTRHNDSSIGDCCHLDFVFRSRHKISYCEDRVIFAINGEVNTLLWRFTNTPNLQRKAKKD